MQAQVAISADFLGAFAEIPRKSQKRVRAFIEHFKADPTHPGIHYESIQAVKDDKVRTVRIGDDYRAVVIRPAAGNVFLLVWVAHHDEAMDWARHKRFEVHPHTGTLQVWEALEGTPGQAGASVPRAPISMVATDVTDAIPSGRLLAGRTNDELLLLGVPEPLVPAVRSLRTEEDLDGLAQYLPEEASDALFLLAAGYSLEDTLDELAGKVRPATAAPEPTVDTSDFAAALVRPGSKRTFKVVEDDDELADILNAPLAKWRIFLHPAQDRLVAAHSGGPMRVLGGAGTGKTVVAMHRARHLAKNVFTRPDQRILVTTFTKNLVVDLERHLGELCGPEMGRIEVKNLDDWASTFLRSRGIKVAPLWDAKVRKRLWQRCASEQAPDSDRAWSFYADEWDLVVASQGCTDEDSYLKARRAGRGTPLSRAQRKEVWKVLAAFRAELGRQGLMDYADILREARQAVHQLREQAGAGAAGVLPYAAVVADETQDFSPQALRLLRALVPEGPNDLFVVGDAHQRIYKHQTSLGACGINVRGRRSRRLTVNYRTTAKIRRFAEALLEGMPVDDLDEGLDSMQGYRSLRLGTAPEIVHCPSADAEAALILERVREWIAEKEPRTVCIAVRKGRLIGERYQPLLEGAGIPTTVIKKNEDATGTGVRLATMHRVKGLEFPLMILASVHQGDMPLELAPDELCDDEARSSHENSERRLLYVAATRARDALLITGYGKRCAWLSGAVREQRSARRS